MYMRMCVYESLEGQICAFGYVNEYGHGHAHMRICAYMHTCACQRLLAASLYIRSPTSMFQHSKILPFYVPISPDKLFQGTPLHPPQTLDTVTPLRHMYLL